MRWARSPPRPTRRCLDDLIALLDSSVSSASSRRARGSPGGEQQRLAVARALPADRADLDGPPHPDRANAQILVDVLAGVAAKGSTMVIATHDAMVIEAGAVIAELDHGRRVR